MNGEEDLEMIMQQIVSEFDLRICEAEEKLLSSFDRLESKIQAIDSQLNGSQAN